MQLDKQKEQAMSIKSIAWVDGDSINEKIGKSFRVPWYGKISINIQTISNQALERIFQERNRIENNLVTKNEIISLVDQSDYYKKIKEQIIDQILLKKFAIIEWPTGTGKTTIAKTIGYEMWLPVFEVWADAEKTIDDFAKEIKTYKKWNVLQIKQVPGLLLKAMMNGAIFLINEANTLPADIQLALANMTESWFVVIWNKKMKIHANFHIIFTSNKWYAGTNEYNKAVERKAGGTILLDYEPDEEGELKILKNIYNKERKKFQTPKTILEKDLEDIVKSIRHLRSAIREYNNMSDSPFLTQDANDFWHFLYIRFYEKLIFNILSYKKSSIDIQKEIKMILEQYLQETIVGITATWEYIEHINDKKKFEEILLWNTYNFFLTLVEEEQSKDKLSDELLWMFSDNLDFLEEIGFETNNIEVEKEQIHKNMWLLANGINPNLFKQVLDNETKAQWEILERVDNIAELAEDMYQKLVDTAREKNISSIQMETLEVFGDVLKLEVNGTVIYFDAKDKWLLENIKTEVDVKNKLFGNEDVIILLYIEETWKYMSFPNFFDHPKSLELRRFSKMLIQNINKKQTLSLLWFSGEIRDIRYNWQDSGDFYIPQSKVNDLLIRNYEIVNHNDARFQNLNPKRHLLALNQYNQLAFLTKEKLDSNMKILKPLERNLDLRLKKNIRNKFANIDKLNLHNGANERSETAIPMNVYGTMKSIQSMLFDDLGNKFEVITKTTENTLQNIEKQIRGGRDILLMGPSGVGKSAYAREIAYRLKLPYIDFQISSDIDETTFTSKNEWNEWELENVFTAFLDYFVNGGVVELKEMNMAPVLTFLNNFLDKEWTVTINWHIYRRNPTFHIISTVNPFDNRIFMGTKPLNLAVQSRFFMLNLDYIEDIEEETDLLIEYMKFKNEMCLENIWEKEMRQYIWEMLQYLVYPLRAKFKELQKTQVSWTDEELKLLSGKVITVDILQKWLSSIDKLDEIKDKIKWFLSFTEEEKNILSNDIRVILESI